MLRIRPLLVCMCVLGSWASVSRAQDQDAGTGSVVDELHALQARVKELEDRVAAHEKAPTVAPPPPTPIVAEKKHEAPAEPFAFGDFTWLNGSSRQHKAILDTPYFTPEFLLDVNYTASTNNPIDNTVVGSTALSRNNELTLAFMGFGGDFHYGAARARLMTQFGVRSTLVPRNDASTNRGQFDLQTALRYVSEAYGGVHLDVLNGINIDAGIFMSYVGLFSFDNFENWMYLPSYTSDNTPWFFNGIRVQVYTSDKLKIEPWIINGWQTYGKFNELPGFGAQILCRARSSGSSSSRTTTSVGTRKITPGACASTPTTASSFVTSTSATSGSSIARRSRSRETSAASKETA